MKRILLCALLAAALSAGCGRGSRGKTDERGARQFSVLNMGDPRVVPQLLGGFHNVENAAWRWTSRKFSVVLRVPSGAAEKGGTISIGLTVPPVSIEKLKDITLSGTVGGYVGPAEALHTTCPPQTFTQAGDFGYKCDVPANILTGPTMRADFQVDKVMSPGGSDIRELGLIVLNIGLESK